MSPSVHKRADRICLYCRVHAEVVDCTPLGKTDICVLSCGHTCSYAAAPGSSTSTDKETTVSHQKDDPKGDSRLLGEQHECPACGDRFRTWVTGIFGRICQQCKQDFGIRNEADVIELLKMLADAPEASKADLLDAAKETVRRGRHSKGSASSATPARPAIDAARVAAAVRSMIEYGLTTPLPATLDKPTNYAIGRSGLFEVRATDIANIITKPTTVLGLTDDLTVGVHLNIPRVPFDMLRQTVAFFRAVCAKSSNEAIVRIWWDRETSTYALRIPDGVQRVGGASVNHTDTFDQDASGRWLHVMDIHSHGSTMSAFWSGTDDADERKAPEGRMFGVIGKVTQSLPEWQWRMRTREGFIALTVADVFDFASAALIPFTVDMGTVLSAASTAANVKDGRVTLQCPVDPFVGATFPEEWLERVSAITYGGHHSAHGSGSWSASHGGYMHQPATQLTSYIYIKSADGCRLLEYEVTPTAGQEPPRLALTGHQVILDPSTVKVDGHS